MVLFILFAFGLAVGSFLNVVATRYDGEHFLFSAKLIGGRSHCEHCKKTLRWYELVPLVSFVVARRSMPPVQGAAEHPISNRGIALRNYFCVRAVRSVSAQAGARSVVAALWVAVFEALLVMTLIDIRLGIIPDEINIFLAVVGVFLFLCRRPLDGAAVLIKITRCWGAGVFFALLIAVNARQGDGHG